MTSSRIIEYRGYELVIHPPADVKDRWLVIIWPPDKKAPLVMPTHASEENAIQDARSAVDRRLDGVTST